MKKYYTYVLKSSLDGLPFYVGKGSNRRMYQHRRDALNPAYNSIRSVHRKIQSILKHGGELIYEVHECADESSAFQKEIELIALYGRKDINTGILCNHTDGGEGWTNVSPESAALRRQAHLGAKRSEQSKQYMSQVQLAMAEERRALYNGSTISEETRQRMSDTRKGKQWTEAARAAIRAKPTAKIVLVYNKDTDEFIGEYESISMCAKMINGDATTIWKILEGKTSKDSKGIPRPMKSHKGYTFKYKDA